MKKITPNGTRTFCTSSPLGRIELEMISPIGSGSSGDLRQAIGHTGDPLRVQTQAIDCGIGQSEAGGSGDVAPVGLDQPGRTFVQQSRGAAEPVLLLLSGHDGQIGRGVLCTLSQIKAIFAKFTHRRRPSACAIQRPVLTPNVNSQVSPEAGVKSTSIGLRLLAGHFGQDQKHRQMRHPIGVVQLRVGPPDALQGGIFILRQRQPGQEIKSQW